MKRRQHRSMVAAGLTLLAAAATLWGGKLGVVTTRDGQTFEGDVTERSGQVVVRRNGIDSVFDKDDVASIDFTSYQDRFNAAIAKLDKDDVAGRVSLAREAFDRREYPLSLQALQLAIDIDPLNRDARQLQAMVSEQVQLQGQTERATTRATSSDNTSDRDSHAGRRLRGLSEEQVNRVRLVELRKDDRVRIQFRDNVRKRFVDSQPGLDFRSFSTRNDVDQAFAIIEKGTPEMVADVAVMNDPSSIQTFGHKLQVPLVQGCASSNCHGGDNAGKFRLLTGPSDASTTVTNFYLLSSYVQKLQSDGGIFAPETASMVDRGNGRNSVLVQYALARKNAKLKHPAVRGWDGLLRDDKDRLAADLVQWMDADLVRLPSPYGFTYTLPSRADATSAPTSSPTTEPTTEPAAR